MSTHPDLQIHAESEGISRPLSAHVNLVGSLLGQVIAEQGGDDMLVLVEELRGLCKDAANTNQPALREQAADRIRTLSLEQITWLLRSFTAFFHLVNQAEQQEIARINRERASHAQTTPRAESIDEAVAKIRAAGLSFDQLQEAINKLDIHPTLTAHPTEARRRSILYKQQDLGKLLTKRQRCTQTPFEQAQNHHDIHNQIRLLLGTDEVRATRPTVADEVEHGLYFVRNAIWETIPRIYQDLRRAVETHYGQTPSLPPMLRYRSWIGSDRDGNPFVTASVTRDTFATQRRTVLELYSDELHELRRELSLSDQIKPASPRLYASIEADSAALHPDGEAYPQYTHEPYRLKLTFMMERIMNKLDPEDTRFSGGASYDSTAFLDDLSLLADCLSEAGYTSLIHSSRLGKLIIRAKAFGFHLMALDVRQHSRLHEATVDELLRNAGVAANYATLPEEARVALLSAELQNPRPLLPHGILLSDEVRPVMESFEAIREAIENEPDAVGSYIVSMTHTVSDLLEVLLIAKENGLWRIENGAVVSELDIAPLFETIEDLATAEDFMEALFAHPVYQKHLAARGQFQEIMLGYSDSNKDGGYWMANWALHQAQDRLGKTCRAHGVDFRLFHGRGGTVGRGGGRANKAVLSMPTSVHNGRIRFTEQGEVISFRYALPDIARRHLEQIVNAMLQSTALRQDTPGRHSLDDPEAQLLGRIATLAMDAYRTLVHAPGLWSWYTSITPIAHISRLPIASRPVSRKSADKVDFESLRAIPWVFAWTQTRYLVPGWYGTGAALRAVLEEDETLPLLQSMYRTWPFFRAVLDSAQREMSRARPEIAARYAQHTPTPQDESFHDTIIADYEYAREAILAITGQEKLLDHAPVIQKSIRLRNPYTDVLNLLQIELLSRWQEEKQDEPRQKLGQALFLSINGIAAAMQSTG